MKMTLRIIPLGGVEEVGINCTVFEYGHDIIVVDLGIGFPGPDFPGIDWLLPDIGYLEKSKHKIRGIVITHGHLDHIGGIPYLINRLGNPPVFATKLTMGLIKSRLKEAGISGLNLIIIEPNKPFSLGSFGVNPFRVVHNIPDSVGLAIKSPIGTCIHTGDFKFDDNPADQKPIDKKKLKRLGKQGVLACLSDSTNAEVSGHTLSERDVGKKINEIIRQTPKRIIFTSFSTLLSRIHQVIIACQNQNRKIAIAGFSIKKSIAIAQELGYIKIPQNLFIDLKDIKRYPDKNLLIIATGTQGEERSAMTRISRNEYRMVRIKKGDTVIFSSSAIPGNELAIHKVMNGLINQGAKIIYQPVLGAGVHSSGHAYTEELKEILKLIKPKFFIPIEGESYMHAQHIEIAKSIGISPKNCFMLKNGTVMEIDEKKRVKILSKKVVNMSLVVEGRRVKDLKQLAVNIRRKMAKSGICIISISHSKKDRKVQVNFLGLSPDKEKIFDTKDKAEKLIRRYGLGKEARITIELRLSDFLLNKIGKKPVVIIV